MMVVDNFINKTELNKIKKEMLHGDFNWFYCQKSLDYDTKIQPMFQHSFLSDNIKSYKFDLIKNLLEKIIKKRKAKNFIRVKSNLYLTNKEKNSHTKHTDLKDVEKYETAIYYLTTTNGSTSIGNKKIKDKENRIVFFDGKTKHNANIQTDKTERMVINFNYIN
tara:strand:+ start:280 stop:771 length:492 start_codon:yes stop_codon:yes gene_type:complete